MWPYNLSPYDLSPYDMSPYDMSLYDMSPYDMSYIIWLLLEFVIKNFKMQFPVFLMNNSFNK